MHTAHVQWLDEHDALATVLHSVNQLAQRLALEPDEVDFCASRAMLLYLSDYPERVHHPHEEHQLFTRLAGHDAELDQTIARLRGQHAASPNVVRQLEHQLNRAEFAGELARKAYAHDVQRFVDGYLAHIEIEERELFPAAERLLTEAEWNEIAEALAQERDPLQGVSTDAAYAELASLLTRVTPAPLGLSDR